MAKNNDKDYRVRRAKGQNDRTAKLPLAHKLRNGGKDYAKKVQARINARGASREVMVKITGSSKTKRGIKNSINYITREGEITLRDNDGKEYQLNSDSERSDAYQYLSDPEDRLMYKDEKAPNLVHNIVFSSPKIAGVSEKDALDSVEKLLKEKYPDNRFVLAYHTDKEHHPHVHALLRIPDNNGKRINIRKNDLRDMRDGFCKNLQLKGYDVKATHRYQQGLKQQLRKEPDRLRNLYEVVEFGRTNYQFDPVKKKQNFLRVKTLKNKTEMVVWGANLADEISREGVKPGSIIRLKKEGQTMVKVPKLDRDGKAVGWMETHRNNWRVENQGMLGIKKTPFDKEIVKDSVEQIKLNQKGFSVFRENRNSMQSDKNAKSIKLGIFRF